MYCRCGHLLGCNLPLPHREGWGGSYTQLVAVKVVAIAVRMVITTLRILPQRVLLLNVPIVVSLRFKV